MLTFVLFVFFVICINFLNLYCIVWVILFHKSCLCLLFADYIILIHFTYLKMFCLLSTTSSKTDPIDTYLKPPDIKCQHSQLTANVMVYKSIFYVMGSGGLYALIYIAIQSP